MPFTVDIAIVGGCGRVGLPLGLALADRGLSVVLYDRNAEAVDTVRAGKLPFAEAGAEEVMARVGGTRLRATTQASEVSGAESVIVVIGTPVDEHLNPDPDAVPRSVEQLAPHLRDGQLLVLRSTLYPGVTALVERLVDRLGVAVEVAFCPERIAEGKAMTELFDLPQIVAARSEGAVARAEKLFSALTRTTIRLSPEEAELAKLFTNTWRYVKFATANQLYMIANDFDLDYGRIREAMMLDYPRAADLPGPGFAAGPCLLKDTMQLAAFNNNNFVLGHASMLVNEGLPLYVVSRLERQYDLASTSVAVLGMAFKAGSDDTRDSLSYKLRRILRFKAKEVVCTDPYVTTDGDLVPLEVALARADLLVIAAPHEEYRTIDTDKPVVDLWGLRGHGTLI
ncbi:MAG TPA: nucleotide sugar dehydrogenase [Acidimicrobiales bacterium]|nr:nucleotide sugar dehydrogenase [Acidimicrobiales bacterium]